MSDLIRAVLEHRIDEIGTPAKERPGSGTTGVDFQMASRRESADPEGMLWNPVVHDGVMDPAEDGASGRQSQSLDQQSREAERSGGCRRCRSLAPREDWKRESDPGVRARRRTS